MGKWICSRKGIISACVFLILVLVMIYGGLRIAESTGFFGQGDGQTDTTRKTIEVDGVEYFPRQDITVLLIMGIDQYGPLEDSGSYRNTGDADVVMLVVFDDTAKRYDILTLNRDTMLEMPVLGLGGAQAGTAYAQLALAYTYGSGLEDSCENVKTTVSQFLLNVSVDYYVAMSMDAIAILNDAVDGVTVTVTEDFSAVDSTISQGEVTLMGQQAIHYLRTRKDVGDQLNISRVERHKAYMNGFLQAYEAADLGTVELLRLYDQLEDYVVTDCSSTTMSTLMDRFSEYTFGEFYSPEGENVLGSTYYEFYADEQDVQRLALKLFYAPKE